MAPCPPRRSLPARGGATTTAGAGGRAAGLSESARATLALVPACRTLTELADRRGCSAAEALWDLGQAIRALGGPSVGEAVAEARRRGLIA